jgi:heme/copper-type cytochrome/quinol oxidase subunit 2
MKFLEQVKFLILTLAAVSVILLLYYIFGVIGFRSNFSNLSFVFDHGTFTWVRTFLFVIEGIWLIGLAFFFYVLSKKVTTGKDEETIRKIEEFEPKYFIGVVTLLFVLFIATFAIPYIAYDDGMRHFHGDKEGDVKIYVIAYMFEFRIDNSTGQTQYQAVDGITNTGYNYSINMMTFPEYNFVTGQRYAFYVRSLDTNHAFGIYDPDGKLLGQNQIVAGYENTFYETFTKTGIYQLVCMEYCGAGHHSMDTYFIVS